MDEFTELKWVTIQTGQQKFPFWSSSSIQTHAAVSIFRVNQRSILRHCLISAGEITSTFVDSSRLSRSLTSISVFLSLVEVQITAATW